MFELFRQAMRAPWAVFAWSVTQLAQGMRRAADGTIDIVAGGFAGPFGSTRTTTSGGALPDAGTTTTKEAQMSERCYDDCGTGEAYCEIRLFQYSIVSIKRGKEAILEYGQKLVTDPMNECDFDSWVIADYVADHKIPEGERKYLRVWSQLLKVWEKQSLHYPQRQLDILQEIADSLGGRYPRSEGEARISTAST
jgi:hypothetical protein